MYEPKTDLQIKYELSREYLFEQMMPPGAPFGSYRIIPFPFYERRIMDTLPVPADPDSPLWYLEMILLPTGCNAYTIEGLVMKSGTENPPSILFSLFILSFVAIPAMLISSWWLHQRYKRLISVIQKSQ